MVFYCRCSTLLTITGVPIAAACNLQFALFTVTWMATRSDRFSFSFFLLQLISTVGLWHESPQLWLHDNQSIEINWNIYTKIVYLQDELLWGAAWLHKASRKRVFREYIVKNEVVLRAGDTINEFGWDNKHAGINVLISKVHCKI